MPLKWFRSHRRSSTEDEVTRPSTETMTPKQKTKRNKSVTQRSRRSHSQGSGLRAMIGLGGSMQNELDAAAAIAAEEEQRRMSYQNKTHRRFTIHGLTYHHKHNEEEEWSCNSTPAGSPLPMYASMSPSHTHSRHFGLGSGRMPHGRSPHSQQMTPLSPNSHPSIIFIDCPP